MSKDWFIVQYFTTGNSMEVGYFYKTDAEVICKHFSQFCCDLIAINHGVAYRWIGNKFEKVDPNE